MSSGKEVITVQMGSLANFVGAHYFNIQNAGFSFNPEFPSEIDHDILFREGLSDSGSFTYTPRLVSVDFEGSLTTLSKSGVNFVTIPTPEEVKATTHVENVEIHQEAAPPKNEYQEDVEKQTKAQDDPDAMDVDLVLKTKYDLSAAGSWPELLTLSLHPRSIAPIPKTLTCGLDPPRTTFKVGTEIWNSPAFFDGFEDNLRFQLEACDTVQGFQVLAECENLYSGLSNGCLDYLRDECPKKSVLTVPIFGLFRSDVDGLENRKQLCSNLINTAHSFSRCHELSDLVSPFSTLSELWTEEFVFRDFSNLDLRGSSIYHSSAVMAAALELVTSPYRLKRLPETRMSHVVALHGLPGRRFVGAGLVFPFPEAKPEPDILAILKNHKYASEMIKSNLFSFISRLPCNSKESPILIGRRQAGVAGYTLLGTESIETTLRAVGRPVAATEVVAALGPTFSQRPVFGVVTFLGAVNQLITFRALRRAVAAVAKVAAATGATF